MSSMIRIFKLVLLLVCSQVVFGQAPSNYTNINGRYRWIAGMFDSTFHIPKGSTPSLRTGGSTNAGGLFYNTSDSSVYTYTGTQWIKVRGSITPSDTTNKYVTQVYKKNGSDSVFYVKGGNHLFAFVDSVGSPGGGGGGKVYYFNGGVNMGTFGGLTMYELGDTANTGAAANFTRATTGAIANFITDPNKPGLLQIPAGSWTIDAWMSETGSGANHAQVWAVLEKWNGSTITTIATSPIEEITEGNSPNLYTWAISVPTTSLLVTDRIIIQFYITNTNGKTVTLYTQNGYVGEVHTTFTTGIGAINGLTAPAQYLVTGTSGTDFNINSSTATHTFNLPTASATNRGALSSADWTTFNSKLSPADTVSLSNRINLKLNISDTAAMLSPYLRSNVAAATYVPQTRTITINGTSQDLTANRTYNVGTVTSVGATAGTGISVSGSPITSSGSFTITNTAPDQTVVLNNGTGISVSGTYPNFTITNTSPSSGGTVTSVGSGTGLSGGPITTSGTLSVDTLLMSTRAWRQKGIDSVQANLTAGLAGKVNISDTASMLTPYLRKIDTTAMLTPYLRTNVAAATYVPQSRTITINGTSQDLSANRTFNVGTVTSVGITAGTGISVANSPVTGSGNITVTNTAPDQTVILSAGTGISIAGTYPSFTITNSSPSSGGTVTSVGSGTGLTGGPITTSGTLAVDTNLISTRLWRQKGVDSVAALANTKVSSVSGTSPISSSGGTSPTISISQASGSTNGFLSSTDWTTFNNKQNALTNPVTGTGTTNYIPKFTSSSAIGNSLMQEVASGISFGGPIYAQDGTSTSASIRFYNSNSGLYHTGSDGLGFITTGSERMRLDASGNLGLGTSSPVSIGNYRTLTIQGGSTSNGGLIQLQNSDASTSAYWFTTNTASTLKTVTNHQLIFGANNTDYLYLSTSGNLGLGVTPSAWSGYTGFQIGTQGSIGATSTVINLSQNVYYGAGGNSYIANGKAAMYQMNDGEHNWRIAGTGTANNAISFTQAMTLDASGRLGIGATSMTYALQVNDVSGGNMFRFTSGSTILDYYVSAGNPSFGTASNNNLGFRTNDTERMRITSGGELLINTTTDAGDFKLQVNGNALFSGTIRTDAPAGYTARDWKLGEKVDAGVTFDGNKYIAIDIGGTVYYLALVTIN